MSEQNSVNESVSSENESTTTETTNEAPKQYSQEYVTRLRNEAAAERKAKAELAAERAELLKFKEERENADLEDQKAYKALLEKERKKAEKLQEDYEKERTNNNNRVKRAELKAQAIAAGIVPEALDDLKSIVDLDEIEINEDGEAVGVEELIATLKEKKKYLFRSKSETLDDVNTDDEVDEEPKPRKRAPVTPSSSRKGPEPIDWMKIPAKDLPSAREEFLRSL